MLSGPLSDSFGRAIRDLRVSLTDRCNFRCLYCLPETEEAANFYRTKATREPGSAGQKRHPPDWKPRSELLTFEEIERLVKVFVALGITKVRLTGGEPLLRQGLEVVVSKIAAIPGIEDLAMTTNGFLFWKKAAALKAAGLKRVSFSMDSLDSQNFQRMTGRDGLEEVKAGIELARQHGFNPVKVNAVVIRGINDHEIEALGAFAHEQVLSFRFIEFMPLDSGRSWLKEMVVPGREILQRLQGRFALLPLKGTNPAETARRWTFSDGKGEIGIIAPVTEPFCGHCNRVRLTADGKIRTCLFSLHEHDVKAMLRAGASDSELTSRLRDIVWQKEARHHIGEPEFEQPERTMSCIGG
jgi:cyclic pyranopterin phosphate synthase